MARIMIIDDDIELTENTALFMREKGHEVATLNETGEAERKIAEIRPDLVILDVMFPDNPVSGFDLARQLRRAPATRELPILLLTGINQEFPMDFSATDIDPDWMPVQAFMEKPVNLPTLLEKVDRMLNRR